MADPFRTRLTLKESIAVLEVAYREIIKRAQRGEGHAITYGELSELTASCIAGPPLDPHLEVGWIAGYLSDHEHLCNRPALGVLVVREDTKMPGQGFYKWAFDHGRVLSDRVNEAFALAEMRRCFTFWRPWKGKGNPGLRC